ncbi:hypothetical protein [Sphingopyxis sp. DBS4]|uniref:hypothetical protein n=1 Tax=Sphingopyxis sp. DBS4 TaxID=2968500 RepID=UPI00214B9EA5|nr:hypothetical protein [Sphingopyxis sp. DBS4]
MRVVIIITPGAPQRAKQKGRDHPGRTAAVAKVQRKDGVQRKDDVIAVRGLRPVLDAHAVSGRDKRRDESTCVAI